MKVIPKVLEDVVIRWKTRGMQTPGKTNAPSFLIALYARVQSVSRNTPAVLLLVSVQQRVQLEVHFWSCLAVVYGSAMAALQENRSFSFSTCPRNET